MPGGLHLEMSALDVTECLGGRGPASIDELEQQLAHRLRPAPQPRPGDRPCRPCRGAARVKLVATPGAALQRRGSDSRRQELLAPRADPRRAGGGRDADQRAARKRRRAGDGARGRGARRDGRASRAGRMAVRGARWTSPAAPIDCGNSGTAARLLMGAVRRDRRADARRFTGDASLSSAADAAGDRAARADGRAVRRRRPSAAHRPRRSGSAGSTIVNVPASAQVKSAILLAGLGERRAGADRRAGPEPRP